MRNWKISALTNSSSTVNNLKVSSLDSGVSIKATVPLETFKKTHTGIKTSTTLPSNEEVLSQWFVNYK
jgi:expansin (peptidoglycan-binding protein)